MSGYFLACVVHSVGGLLGDGREDKGLIALFCGRSDLNIWSGEYIAAALLQGEVECKKKHTRSIACSGCPFSRQIRDAATVTGLTRERYEDG